jgi:hypothetical protein
MSSSSSNSWSPYNSDDSDVNYYSDYEREVESDSSEVEVSGDKQQHKSYQIEREFTTNSSNEESALCADDPVADAEWTAQYEEQIQEITAEEQRLTDRLNGEEESSEW